MQKRLITVLIILILALLIINNLNNLKDITSEAIKSNEISKVKSIPVKINGSQSNKRILTINDKEKLGKKDLQPKFNKNKVIIKFKENKFSFDKSKKVLSINEVKDKLPSSVNLLNNKYKVKELRKLSKENSKIKSLKNVYVFSLEQDQDIDSLIKEYSKDPNVERVEKDYIMKTSFVPNDPLFSKMYSLDNNAQDYSNFYGSPGNNDADIDFPEALDTYNCPRGVICINPLPQNIVVGVIDTGVDYNHEDLNENMWVNPGEVPNNNIDDDNNGYIDDVNGWNFVNQNKDPIDTLGHGTHVSGTIAAVQNNNRGISGVCKNCKIMALKAGDENGLSLSNILDALAYAVNNGAKITSNSYGGYFFSQIFQDAINDAYSNGLIFVAAAGNDNTDLDTYFFSPCAFNNVICVAATDNKDYKAFFSNYGSKVDVSAPGIDIYSLRAQGTDMYLNKKHIINENGVQDNNGKYYISSGTSMATPLVSGLAGAIWGKNPTLTNTQIETVLKTYTDNISTINSNYPVMLGTGKINLKYSLNQNLPNHDIGLANRIPYLMNNTETGFNISITNKRNFPESNINIDFYFDNIFIETKNIAQINPGETQNLRFNYDLTNQLYSHSIKFVVNIVQGEEYTADNIIDKKISIYKDSSIRAITPELDIYSSLHQFGYYNDLINNKFNIIYMQNKNSGFQPLLFQSLDNGLIWTSPNSKISHISLKSTNPPYRDAIHKFKSRGNMMIDALVYDYVINVYVSLDEGNNWIHSQPIDESGKYVDVAINGNTFYIVTQDKDYIKLYSSRDGVNWQVNNLDRRYYDGHIGVEIYNNKLYLLGSISQYIGNHAWEDKPKLFVYDLSTNTKIIDSHICDEVLIDRSLYETPSLIIDRNEVYALYSYGNPWEDLIKFAHSSDGGQTWDNCQETANLFYFNGRSQLIKQNNRLIYSVDGGFNDNFFIAVQSLNNGLTWSRKIFHPKDSKHVVIRMPVVLWNNAISDYLFVFVGYRHDHGISDAKDALYTSMLSTTCFDGSSDGVCSLNKPLFCNQGSLVNKCSVCSCDIGSFCQADGNCIAPIIRPTIIEPKVSLISPSNNSIYDVSQEVNFYCIATNPSDLGLISLLTNIDGSEHSFNVVASKEEKGKVLYLKYSGRFGLGNHKWFCEDMDYTRTHSYSSPLYEFKVMNLPSCSDNTKGNSCSLTKPNYCFNNGTAITSSLINNCNVCGCNTGYSCSNNVCIKSTNPLPIGN